MFARDARNRKYVSGAPVMYRSAAVAWYSYKQALKAMSTAEVAYIPQIRAMKNTPLLKRLI